MSLGHTFSSALHYKGPVTSSGTPIKAIQAKSCVSPGCFFFSLRCRWDLLQSISVSSPVCLSSPVEICSLSLNDFIKTYELSELQNGSFFWGSMANLPDSLLVSLRCLWLDRLCWDTCQDSQDASLHPLWYTSKLWAADNLGTPHPSSCHVGSLPC